tara:strand:+ start:404 stop:565 length:162 start_codon:yes stop_codon:yes gene_type:complete
MHDPVYLENEYRILHNQLRRFSDEAVLPNGKAQKALELTINYVKNSEAFDRTL